MFKVWMFVLILTVDGTRIIDVKRTVKPFDSYYACERARARVGSDLTKGGQQFITVCKADGTES